MAAKKIKLDEPAGSEILVADTDSELGAEASDLEDEFSESKEELDASAQEDEPQAATSGGGPTTWGPPQGRNIKIHPFVGPAKGLKRKRGSTHQQRQLTSGCVDAVFHRHFSAAGGTDKLILPATLGQTSRI